MSKKRFVIDEEGILDTSNDKWYSWKEEFVDLLNSFNEENRQLKIENEFLRMEYDELKSLIEKQEQKKLVVTITPTLYGWKSKVEELE